MFRHMNGLTQLTGCRPWHMIAAAIKSRREVGAPAMSTKVAGAKPSEFGSNILDGAFSGIRGAAEHNCHLHAAAPLEDFHRDFVGMTPHLEVDAGLLELQIAQHQLVQERRQARIEQPDLVGNGIELQPERSLDQRERSGAGPCLWRTRDGIVGRPASPTTLKAAE